MEQSQPQLQALAPSTPLWSSCLLSGIRLLGSEPLPVPRARLASRVRKEGLAQQTLPSYPASAAMSVCTAEPEEARPCKLWVSACRPLVLLACTFSASLKSGPASFCDRIGLRTCTAKIWKPKRGQHEVGVQTQASGQADLGTAQLHRFHAICDPSPVSYPLMKSSVLNT